METIRGRTPCSLDTTELFARLAAHQRVILDLGTGDGKFAFHHARAFPGHFVIGVDSCRENLRELSRVKLPNLLYIIASAQNLPSELCGLVSHITINFPWGSLLESLLNGDTNMLHGLNSISQAGTTIDVRLNGGALTEQCWSLEDGAGCICENLTCSGWHIGKPVTIDSHALRSFPSTWAKRLAFGRDSRAVRLSGTL